MITHTYGAPVRITDELLRQTENVPIFGIFDWEIDESIPDDELRFLDQDGNIILRVVNIGS